MEVINLYNPGYEKLITARVRNLITGDLYDPSALKFHIKNALGVLSTKVYGSDADITRSSTGVYVLALFVPYSADANGPWYYDCQTLDSSNRSTALTTGAFRIRLIPTLQT